MSAWQGPKSRSRGEVGTERSETASRGKGAYCTWNTICTRTHARTRTHRSSVPAPEIVNPFSRAWALYDHMVHADRSETFRLHYSYPPLQTDFRKLFPVVRCCLSCYCPPPQIACRSCCCSSGASRRQGTPLGHLNADDPACLFFSPVVLLAAADQPKWKASPDLPSDMQLADMITRSDQVCARASVCICLCLCLSLSLSLSLSPLGEGTFGHCGHCHAVIFAVDDNRQTDSLERCC